MRRCGCSRSGARRCCPGLPSTPATARRWRECAGQWTGSRWRSSWPRCGCGRCRRDRSCPGWIAVSVAVRRRAGRSAASPDLAGEAEQAADWYTTCADVCQDSGNAWYHAYARWGLAVVALLRGDHEDARRLGRGALRQVRGMDDSMGVVLCLDALSWVAAAHREAIRALTLAAAAEAAWAAIRPRQPARSARSMMRRSARPGRPCLARSTARRSRRAARWIGPRPSRSP